MSWLDEKEIVIVGLIASLLFMTILDLKMGAIYTGMISLYWISMHYSWKVQFSKDRKYLSPAILIVTIIGLMAYYMVAQAFNLPVKIQSLIGFSIDTISTVNPILKSLIWILFIPLAETLFFFGVLFGYMRYKFRNIGYLIFIPFGIMIALFHTLSQNMTQQTIIIDIIFGVISGITLLKYNELKYAFWIHVIANLLFINTIGGLTWLLLQH